MMLCILGRIWVDAVDYYIFLIMLTSVYVMALLYSFAVLVLLTGIFVGALTLIWSILMLELISKVLVDNGFNH